MEDVSLEIIEKEKYTMFIKLINDKCVVVMETEIDFSEGFNMKRIIWLAEKFDFKIKNVYNK